MHILLCHLKIKRGLQHLKCSSQTRSAALQHHESSLGPPKGWARLPPTLHRLPISHTCSDQANSILTRCCRRWKHPAQDLTGATTLSGCTESLSSTSCSELWASCATFRRQQGHHQDPANLEMLCSGPTDTPLLTKTLLQEPHAPSRTGSCRVTGSVCSEQPGRVVTFTAISTGQGGRAHMLPSAWLEFPQ